MLNSRRIEDLKPYVAFQCRTLIARCKAVGINLIVTGTLRDQEYQNECFRKGVGPKLLGPHGFGLAFDVAPIVHGKAIYNDNLLWSKIGAIGEALGLEWSGHWKKSETIEKCHFQFTGGLSDTQIRVGKLPKFPPIPSPQNQIQTGGLNIMDSKLNLKPICKGRISEKTSTLPCCSEPANDKRTGSVLKKGKNEPFNIYAKAHNDKENCDYYLVNVNPKCIQWVAAGYVILIL